MCKTWRKHWASGRLQFNCHVAAFARTRLHKKTKSLCRRSIARVRLEVTLTPNCLIIGCRFTARDRDRLPLVAGEDSRDHDDLANVIPAMRQRPMDGQRYRV